MFWAVGARGDDDGSVFLFLFFLVCPFTKKVRESRSQKQKNLFIKKIRLY